MSFTFIPTERKVNDPKAWDIFLVPQLFLRWHGQVSNLIWSGSGMEGHCAKLNQICPAASLTMCKIPAMGLETDPWLQPLLSLHLYLLGMVTLISVHNS